MKQVLAIAVISFFIIPAAYAATAGSINDAVEKKMREINASGKTGPFVEEIKMKRGSRQETTTVATNDKSNYIGTLSALNIVGGIFEGGVLGTGIGLIGYSQSMNRDTKPLINGAIIGTVAGAVLGVTLSLVELGTQRHSASDDMGFDIAGGTIVGAALGSAGGIISWGKTKDLENISEGTGYGIAIGALCGMILGIVESFIPENIRGGETIQGGSHAFIRQLDANTTVLSCNFTY